MLRSLPSHISHSFFPMFLGLLFCHTRDANAFANFAKPEDIMSLNSVCPVHWSGSRLGGIDLERIFDVVAYVTECTMPLERSGFVLGIDVVADIAESALPLEQSRFALGIGVGWSRK